MDEGKLREYAVEYLEKRKNKLGYSGNSGNSGNSGKD
jgi:hypothetical protein